MIDYQELFILENSITVSWFLNNTCSHHFEVQGYTLSTGVPVLSPDHVFAVGQETSIVISDPRECISYKILAFNTTGEVCASSRNTYYRFHGITHLKQ